MKKFIKIITKSKIVINMSKKFRDLPKDLSRPDGGLMERARRRSLS